MSNMTLRTRNHGTVLAHLSLDGFAPGLPSPREVMRESEAMLNPAWAHVKNILAIRLDNIGDIVLCTPALRAIKANLPAARLTLMASPTGSRVGSMMPFVDEIIAEKVVWQDVGWKMPLDPEREVRLVEAVRSKGFDAAVIFTSFSQSPYPPAYMCYLAGIPLRLGQSKEFGGSLLTHEIRNPPDAQYQAERNMVLLESVGFAIGDRRPILAIPPWAEESARALLAGKGVDVAGGYIVIHPGASCLARTWSWQGFARVAALLRREVALPLVITGDKKDEQKAAAILAFNSGGLVNTVGETGVEEFAALVEMARLVITNNTSALHLAAATATPMAIAYAGTEYESQWKPAGVPVRFLRRDTPCTPCYLFECPTQHECLAIEPEEVAQAAMELLA